MPVAAAGVVAPNVVIQSTTDNLLAALKKNDGRLEQDKQVIYDLVSDIVLPNFDFVSMSKLALGKYWRTASEEQRSEFVSEFRSLLVNTYAVALTQYSNQEVKLKPFKAREGDRRVTVKTEIIQPGGMPIPMHYKLLLKTEQWKVYDVLVDGVSLVTTYRTAFSQEMRKGGMTAVLNNLRARNAKHETVARQEPVEEPVQK